MSTDEDEGCFKIKGGWGMLDSMVKSLQLKLASLLDHAESQIEVSYEEFKRESKAGKDKDMMMSLDKDIDLFKKNIRNLRKLITSFECEE